MAVFKIEMPKDNWCGLGLGTKDMSAGSDMIMIDSGSQKVYDMVSVGNKQP